MAPSSKTVQAEAAQPSPQKRNGHRSNSPTQYCLRQASSPQKPKRRPKAKPAATQEEIAAQVAARIAQLSAAPATKTTQPPSVKVKSIAELRSTKIARLTTKIAVNEAEIARLEREYALAKERLDRETQALEFRRDALTSAGGSGGGRAITVTDPKTKATLAMMDQARAQLELVADRAQDLLQKFRGGEINERATMRELKNLLEGAKDGGCDVAGLCQMVSSLDFTGAADREVAAQAQAKEMAQANAQIQAKEQAQAKEASQTKDAQTKEQAQSGEAKASRKRKVQDVKAEEQIAKAAPETNGVVKTLDAKADANSGDAMINGKTEGA